MPGVERGGRFQRGFEMVGYAQPDARSSPVRLRADRIAQSAWLSCHSQVGRPVHVIGAGAGGDLASPVSVPMTSPPSKQS